MRIAGPSLLGLWLAGAAMALAGHGPLVAQELRYLGTLGYSGGSYFYGDRTDSFSLLSGLRLSAGRFALSASLPIIVQNSGDVSFLGGGMMPTGARDPGMGSQEHATSGMGGAGRAGIRGHGSFQATLGDPLLVGSFTLLGGGRALAPVEASAMAKAPVASVASGVGTGSWDFGVRASSGLNLGRTRLLAGLSFWSPGDLPGVELKEYGEFSFGMGRSLGTRWSVLATLNLATTVVEGLAAPATAGLALGSVNASGEAFSLGFSVGLNDASPDLGVFVGWGFGLWNGSPSAGR